MVLDMLIEGLEQMDLVGVAVWVRLIAVGLLYFAEVEEGWKMLYQLLEAELVD